MDIKEKPKKKSHPVVLMKETVLTLFLPRTRIFSSLFYRQKNSQFPRNKTVKSSLIYEEHIYLFKVYI